MAVVWRNRDLNALQAYVKAIPERILDAGEDMTREASREGARQMRDFIGSRGTALSGKRGRVESGEMLSNVRNTAERVGATRVRARWGWLNVKRPYFRFQEQGFTHWYTREDVEPMHALLDSFIRTRTEFIANIAKRVR